MIVTLDGPAGAGKSSAARALAARLGWCYLDTGAMYRSITLMALEQGIPLDDAPRVADLVERTVIEFRDGCVLADGRDVSTEIRTDRITQATRAVADAAGGFLGLTARVSDAEKRVLAELEAAFEDARA